MIHRQKEKFLITNIFLFFFMTSCNPELSSSSITSSSIRSVSSYDVFSEIGNINQYTYYQERFDSGESYAKPGLYNKDEYTRNTFVDCPKGAVYFEYNKEETIVMAM